MIMFDGTGFWLPTLIGFFCFAFGGFLLSRILQKNDVADFLWGLGFVIMGLVHILYSDTLTFRGLLSFALTCLWALRLSVYLGWRVLRKSQEDVRYAKMRKEWGSREPIMAFAKVFVLQSLILSVVAMPVILAIRLPPSPTGFFDFLGTCLFILGLLIEATADAQLTKFKKTSPGKLCNVGLWRLSRHPNYFGEILVWWGLFLIVAQGTGLSPALIPALLSPILITFLLLRVSGVPMLEKILEKRGPEFADYVRTTPELFPFRAVEVVHFLCLIACLMVLDFVWLGGVMNEFYLRQTQDVARIKNGNWNVALWPALAVYFAIALGLRVFAIGDLRDRSAIDAAFRGGLFGFASYAIYEFTNMALVKNWPNEMALVDLIWGTALCATASFAVAVLSQKNKRAA